LHYNIPIFIPHLACPFTCVFCNQKHISGVQKPMDIPEIIEKIERNLSTIDIKNSEVEVAFFGGSFTCLDIDQQKKYLEVVQPFINEGKIKSIRLSTRPDFINEEVLNVLKTMRVETIELGVQSMDNDVLLKSGRGHSAEDVIKASLLIKSYGCKLGLQMMVGLPGDTAGKSMQTARDIITLEPDCVRIYPTLVVRNTRLEDLYNKGDYKLLSLEEAIDWVAPLLKLFIQNQINVIRVGLHPSEGFESGENLIAGPYHSSFRELVMTRIWHEAFNSIEGKENSDITISVPFAEYNNAIGYKANNKNILKQKFNRLRFIRSHKLKGLEFHVDYN
jgi:histone acetyltransferase (RNA polymerase elongator complex component)